MKNFMKILALIILIPFTLAGTNIIQTFINGSQLVYEDAVPYIDKNNRVMLPYRVVSETLDLEVKWKDKEVVVTGTNVKDGQKIIVKAKPDSHTISVNGTMVEVESPITLLGERTYIPIRVFAETYGYVVDWYNRTVYIQTPHPGNGDSGNDNNIVIPKPEPPTEEPSPPVSEDVSSMAQEITKYTNEFRAENGLPPLTLDAELSRIADLKSKDMSVNKYFDHNSPTYGSPFDMIKSFGITYKSAGENIAMGYKDARAVVDGWIKSPGHRANMLSNKFTHIGVGYYENGKYYTQMFIGK